MTDVANVSNVTWLTQEALRPARQLKTLSTLGGTEIAKKIELAREEGDLKENGGYHAAKGGQGKIKRASASSRSLAHGHHRRRR